MLKRTYLLLIPAVLCVLSLCVFALIACDDDSDGSGGGTVISCADGIHDFGEYIVQVESNCYRAGAEYRICSRCNCREYRDVEIISNAFANCMITKIVIPSSVTSIMSNVFYEYGSNLVTYYKGSAQELDEKPQIKGLLSRSTVYYYSETEPALNTSGKYDGNFWHYDANNNVVKWEK